jgi:hypothetical protein
MGDEESAAADLFGFPTGEWGGREGTGVSPWPLIVS